ncbi:MAG: aminotransferase class V-fold PLP-dependent enzyme [Pseudomonadota bacterium]
MPIDDSQLARLRADTPACAGLIHFNNAGASLMPTPVFDAVTAHLDLERRIGGYEAAAEAEVRLNRLYTAFAELLGADPSEIAFIENATRAWDMAFYALPLEPGDRIIVHTSEYASSYLAFLQIAKRRGIEVDVAPSDASGQIDVEALPGLVTPKTKLVNLVHVPTQGGLINPAEAVGQFAREYGLLYFLDACQSAGQLDLHVGRLGCHVLSGTGRKYLRGPRGTGFLYVSAEIVDELEPPFIDMRAATWTSTADYELKSGARRFENWESYVAGRVGLAAAVDYALGIGVPAIEERLVALAATLRAKLAAIDGIEVLDQGARLGGICTFRSEKETATALAARLRKERINISVTDTASARLDLEARGIDELARASVHCFNTEDEIARFASVVSE